MLALVRRPLCVVARALAPGWADFFEGASVMPRQHFRTTLLRGVTLSALCALPSLGSDPPFFPTKVYLLGSNLYQPGDWDVYGDAQPIEWTLALQGDGMTYRPKTSAGSTVRHQLIRHAKAVEGEMWARFRIRLQSVTDTAFFIGVWPTHGSPFDAAPSSGAWFEKAGGGGLVKWRAKNGGSGDPTDATTLTSGTDYDLVIRVLPNGSNTKVRFWWRKWDAANFDDSGDITTNTPGSEAALRLSVAVQTGGLGATLTMSVFEYEAGAAQAIPALGIEQFGHLGTLGLNVVDCNPDCGNEDADSDWYVRFDNGASIVRTAVSLPG
jgi:hypothetical protein